VLNPALFNTSGFLPVAPAPNLAINLPASYSDSYPIQNTPQNTPDSPKFSEYLASINEKVNEKSGKSDESAVSTGNSAAADKEDESPAVTEKIEKPEDEAGENYLVMAQNTVHDADTALLQPARDPDGAEEKPVKLSNDAAAQDGATLDLEAAAQAPEIEVKTTAPPPESTPDIEKNAVANKTDGGDENKAKQVESVSETDIPKTDARKDAGAPKNDGGKPFNASEGIYIDEKKSAAEQLAAETNDGAAKKKQTRFENGTVASAADSRAEISAVPAAAAAGTAGAMGTAGQVKGAEKDGGGKTSGEKKSTERTKRNTGYVETNAGPVDGAAQITETREVAREVRRVSAGGTPETEITVNLRGETRGASAGGQDGLKTSGTFENFLARELQQNLNGEIVRQAQVMLREGGEGTIRLSLKPEFLGKVKIHLEMTENKITGKIVVESGEALRAFEREMQALEQSFRGEGFDGANLSLELAEHKDPRSGEGGRLTDSEKSLIRTASSKYDGAVDKVLYFGAAYSAKQINVLI
jgi:flagellar hook-length control protein FliK